MRRLGLAALALMLFPAVAWSTSIRPRSLADLVAEAEQVLQGRVVSAQAVREGNLVFTDYAVEVEEWLKPGARGEAATITVRQPGGRVGDLTMTVVGAAHFAIGDDLVLFTRDYGGLGHQQVANLQQGALHVTAETVPGAAPGATRRRVPQAAAFPQGAPDDLGELKSRVRALVAAGRR